MYGRKCAALFNTDLLSANQMTTHCALASSSGSVYYSQRRSAHAH